MSDNIDRSGTRAVVVITSGWIYAGDVEERGDWIRLHDPVHVFSWREVGFEGACADETHADIRKCVLPAGRQYKDVPYHAVIFTSPVPDGWGHTAK